MAIEEVAAVQLPSMQNFAVLPLSGAPAIAPAEVAAFQRARAGVAPGESVVGRVVLDSGNYRRLDTDLKGLKPIDRMRADVHNLLVSTWNTVPRAPDYAVDPANPVQVATHEAIHQISEATQFAVRITLKMAILGIYFQASQQTSKSASDDFKSMLKQQ